MIYAILYSIYYLAAIGGVCAAAICFYDATVLGMTSLVPGGIAALMLYQAYSFYKKRQLLLAGGVDTREVREAGIFMATLVHTYLLLTPTVFPLIPFLDAWGKCLAMLPFFLASVIGALAYRRGANRRAKEEAEAVPTTVECTEFTDLTDTVNEESEDDGE
ncbi:MAG: hypothetical protein J6Q69_06115 [Clostridia bacterium]|nr:hypothetical protein [Clostridia bacterium]